MVLPSGQLDKGHSRGKYFNCAWVQRPVEPARHRNREARIAFPSISLATNLRDEQPPDWLASWVHAGTALNPGKNHQVLTALISSPWGLHPTGDPICADIQWGSKSSKTAASLRSSLSLNSDQLITTHFSSLSPWNPVLPDPHQHLPGAGCTTEASWGIGRGFAVAPVAKMMPGCWNSRPDPRSALHFLCFLHCPDL